MSQTLGAQELMLKIARAQIRLEDAKRPHSEKCIINLDPESHSPCNCGASEVNTGIDKALSELRI